jgi:A/G-specific adenine glycosylase
VALPTAELQALAHGLAPADRPAAWTAALMDIGATLCRPARPACPSCPLRTWCRYASEGRAAAKEAAATDGAARAGGRSPAVSFEQTNRWLRGRIVDRLRDLPDGTWYRLETPIGSHGPDAVTRAVAALAAEGLLEQDAAGRVRLPR